MKDVLVLFDILTILMNPTIASYMELTCMDPPKL